ncbi:MAG TPA: hypothetical protein VMS16_08020 [Mycobacterium sp.]|jgi:hypothetical protein|nr:hypothetical protein [Mycobacterium sp.]
MPKGIMYVASLPVSPDKEADYHDWYNETHLAELSKIDGIVSARRFAPTDGEGPFIAIYELDSDNLDGVLERMGELAASGQMSSLEFLSLDPPPVPKIYREIASFEP